jgi:hypothetical protein
MSSLEKATKVQKIKMAMCQLLVQVHIQPSHSWTLRYRLMLEGSKNENTMQLIVS